jgi:hypothetical protein
MAGTGEQPLSGDTTTVKQVGRDFGPSQRFTMDWSNIDGSTENIVCWARAATRSARTSATSGTTTTAERPSRCPSHLGKTAGKDEATEKATWPAVYGIDQSQRDAARLIEEAFAALEPYGSRADGLKAIARYLVERKN